MVCLFKFDSVKFRSAVNKIQHPKFEGAKLQGTRFVKCKILSAKLERIFVEVKFGRAVPNLKRSNIKLTIRINAFRSG